MLYNKSTGKDWDYKLNPVADTLMKAADLLEKYGHAKHVRVNFDGSLCFLGAVEMAQGRPIGGGNDTPLTLEAAQAVAKVLGLPSRNDPFWSARHVVADWNNGPLTTGQEVIDAMRKAAKSLVTA